MHVAHLSLTNFRNYGRLELSLPPGPTLLHGDNAQGKTNLLEAIYYLATTRSSHADSDKQLINWDALRPEEPVIAGRLVAQIETQDGPKQVEMRLIKEQGRGGSGFRREALVNRRKVRLMDLLGNLQVVLFLPQDLEIITSSPSRRRRYLDITLCQADRSYCRALSAYNKVLEQRNALLRRIAEGGNGLDVLPVYTEKLVTQGSLIFKARSGFIAALAQVAGRLHYEALTDRRESLRLNYLPRLLARNLTGNDGAAIGAAEELGQWLHEEADRESVADRFAELLDQVKGEELASGMTKVGPHRDDWRFSVNGRQLNSYGSRGQQRSAILAMKLAEIEWMASQIGERPVLLLDEVMAELDERRRALLLETVGEASQAILTATDPKMFTPAFLDSAATMTVSSGQVTLDAKENASR